MNLRIADTSITGFAGFAQTKKATSADFERSTRDEADSVFFSLKTIVDFADGDIEDALIEKLTDCHGLLGKLRRLLEDDDIEIKISKNGKKHKVEVSIPHNGFPDERHKLMTGIIKEAIEKLTPSSYDVEVTIDKKRNCSYRQRWFIKFTPVTYFEAAKEQTVHAKETTPVVKELAPIDDTKALADAHEIQTTGGDQFSERRTYGD